MKLMQTCVFVILSFCTSVCMAQSGDLSVSGITITADLAVMNLDCTANGNGGKLTTDSLGQVVCADDSGTTGPHTVDTNLSEGEVDAFVANNGYSTGAHTVDTDTHLSESEVDAFVANNGYSTGYGNRTVVALSGGDYTDPVAAMTDRANWCGVPSITNPCLMKIMPGIYNLSTTLPLISYIDVEGSGRNITVLIRDNTGFNGGIISANGQCASETCEVRDLSLKANGSGGSVTANGIYSSLSAGPRVRNVDFDISVTGGTANGVFADGGDISLIDCNIMAGGDTTSGVRGDSSTIKIRNCIVQSSGSSNFGTLHANDSDIETENSEFMRLGASINAYAVFLNDSNLTDSGSAFHAGQASSVGTGIFAQSTGAPFNVNLTHSKVIANHPLSAANKAIFLFRVGLTMSDTFVQAVSASGDNTGIEVNRSFATIDSSEIIAGDKVFVGSGTSGGPYFVRISNARLLSINSASVIQGSSQFTIAAYHSRLSGGAPVATGITCASVVDENYTFYPSTCPP